MAVPTSPPRGHPMEPGKFPGPLYPPGAAPRYTPSKKTPFAVAVKRAMGHCGFWPWDPSSYDQSWSDAVAFGVESNAEKAGMKAMQRWSGTIEPTGNVGEKTFNFLRSVTVPQGRPQAGNPAWDQVCIQLTQQANEELAPPAPQTTLREKALKQAISKLGVKESPPDSNQCEFTKWYGMVGPWCAMFCTWAYETSGDSPSFVKGSRYAYVPYIVSDARGARYGLSVVSPANVKPGDMVCFDWQGGGSSGDAYGYDHVGLFEAWQDGNVVFSSIEGNTSTSNNSNGGEVMRRSRNINSQGTVFVRVAEP